MLAIQPSILLPLAINFLREAPVDPIPPSRRPTDIDVAAGFRGGCPNVQLFRSGGRIEPDFGRHQLPNTGTRSPSRFWTVRAPAARRQAHPHGRRVLAPCA